MIPRNVFLACLNLMLGLGTVRAFAQDETPAASHAVRPLANEYVVVYESPDPARVYAYSPGPARLPNGRLLATMDQGGPGVKRLPGVKHAATRMSRLSR